MSSIASGAGGGGGGGSGSGRTFLTTNTTWYVATTGSDTLGTGTIGSPWLTIQHACDVIASTIDFNGFDGSVQIADGSYNGFFIGAMQASLGSVTSKVQNIFQNAILTFYSASADYTKVLVGIDAITVGSCISIDAISPVLPCIKNMTVDCRALPQGSGINAGGGSFFAVGDGNGGTVRFLSDPANIIDNGEPLSVNSGGFLILNDTILLDGGNWDYFVNMSQGGGRVQMGNGIAIGAANSLTINFANTPHGNRFINSIDNGFLTAPGGSITIGAGAGPWSYSFHISVLGGIDVTNVSGAGLNFFPGSNVFSNGAEYAWNDGTQDRLFPGEFIGISKAGLPANTDLVAGTFGLIKDTSGGGVYVAYNDAGTIKKVALT